MGRSGRMFVMGCTVALGACGQPSDPTALCESMAFGGGATDRLVAPSDAPLFAISAVPDRPVAVAERGDAPDVPGAVDTPLELTTVLVREGCVCDGPDPCGCTGGGSGLVVETLALTAAGSQLLITSDAGYLVSIHPPDDGPARMAIATLADPRGTVRKFEILRADQAQTLVATLRGSDWLVVRDGTADRSLRRFHPAAPDAAAEALAPGGEDLQVLVTGHRYLLARELLGDEEALHLVPVDPPAELHWDVGDPVRLIQDRPIERAVIVPDPYGDDRFAVATLGRGDDAETLVFAIPSGDLVERFSGTLGSGATDRADVPGLFAHSPDGAHLPYVTRSGALALRDLEVGGACLVRGADAGSHELAGFSADGILFMQAEDRGGGVASSRVFAYLPESRTIHALGRSGRRLHGVPGRAPWPERSPEPIPWALAKVGWTVYAVQAHVDDVPLPMLDVLALPTDGERLWVLESELHDDRHLGLWPLDPRSRSQDTLEVRSGGDPVLSYDFPAQDLCLATGQPGGWTQSCGATDSADFTLRTSPPRSEHRPAPEPRAPAPS